MGVMIDTAAADVSEALRGFAVTAIGAYENGRYENAQAARRAFPHAHVLGIDVLGTGVGHAGDFEAGDMAYAEAGRWAHRRRAAGVLRPVIYFSVSNWQAVMSSLQAAGLTRSDVRLWTAHYTGQPHLCSSACNAAVSGQADATQWGSANASGTLPAPWAGRDVDVSETAPDFW